jgi:hypothetical protein
MVVLGEVDTSLDLCDFGLCEVEDSLDGNLDDAVSFVGLLLLLLLSEFVTEFGLVPKTLICCVVVALPLLRRGNAVLDDDRNAEEVDSAID